MDEKRLAEIPLFAGLSKDERRRIARIADECDVRAGKELIHKGRHAYEFFVIVDGTAEVLRDDVHVADVGSGDVFGELAALEDGTRNATVRATSPMTVIVLLAQDLRRLTSEIPVLAERVRAIAEARRSAPA